MSGMDSWPEVCPICMGKCRIALTRIAKMMDEDPALLFRLTEMRVRPSTGQRLLRKLCGLINCSRENGE